MAYGSFKPLSSKSYRTSGTAKLYNTSSYRQRSATTTHVKSRASMIKVGGSSTGVNPLPTSSALSSTNPYLGGDYTQILKLKESVDTPNAITDGGAWGLIYFKSGKLYTRLPNGTIKEVAFV